ncbi:hypothetical protein Pfo_024514 [Paulownia fortunei]|nr:hypothetical protein Pfo_024514 [Paulownia fortunei]
MERLEYIKRQGNEHSWRLTNSSKKPARNGHWICTARIALCALMAAIMRIAAAYCVAAMCEIWLRNVEKVSSGLSLLKKYQWHWTVMFLLTTIYLLLLYGFYVRDWEYQIPYDASSEAKIFMVKCGVRGDTGPASMQYQLTRLWPTSSS